ncbi:MAG TPA: hypothetical protein VGH74_09475 [Planctomycetaceae bacterium]|jgi:hypothetical protein
MRRWKHVLLIAAAMSLSLAALLKSANEPATKSGKKKPQVAPPAADMPAATANDQVRKERLDFFVPRLKELRLHDSGEPLRPFALVETPLFSFDNPVSFISDGFMFVWTDRGRPAVAMKSYYNGPQKSWGRTFVSLSERSIVLESGDKTLWTPPEAAAVFKPLADAPIPADRPNARLAQMRKLAERFQIVDNWGMKDPTDWQLRLLTTPLYRYEVPDENVVDAALFGYVLTTSPEALVLLEARRSGNELAWYYAVSRFTRFGITISLDDRKLAEFPRLEAWPPTGAYFHDPLPLPDYPFKNKWK